MLHWFVRCVTPVWFYWSLLLVLGAGGVAMAQPLGPNSFKVTLLGTGSPAPVLNRFGPGVLVQAGGKNLLFDCGRGTSQRILQSGLKLGQVDAVFLTHLHSDHIVGLPDLWLTGWLEAAYAQRKGPLVVYGPAGTQALMTGLRSAFDWDIRARIADQHLSPISIQSAVTEIKPGVIYDQQGLKVTAIEVDHGELLQPAFGYRIDFDGRSVTLSGDTRFSENLIQQAQGTDLLIHQVAAAHPDLLKQPAFQVIMAHHTSPQEAGVVFSRVKPRMAVFYHFVLLGTPAIAAVTEQEVLALARTTYDGPMLIGEDRMAFELQSSEVKLLPLRTP